jgi:NifU-like protein involved in Fe-S cluster formation
MDPAVIHYYKKLLKEGFGHAGEIESPTLFLDTVSENVSICGNLESYLHLYINIQNRVITEVKYLCTCDPPANVAVEIFCILLKGKTVEAVKTLTKESFFDVLEAQSQELAERAEGLMELLNRGLSRLNLS